MSPEEIAKLYLWPTYQEFVHRTSAVFPTSNWQHIALVGAGSKMDSLKFVRYVIEIERRMCLRNVIGKETGALEPFKTMGSFAKYIHDVLEVDSPP